MTIWCGFQKRAKARKTNVLCAAQSLELCAAAQTPTTQTARLALSTGAMCIAHGKAPNAELTWTRRGSGPTPS
jgi:hypothetical protein